EKPFIAAHIAVSHTLFNVTNVLIFLPFLPLLERLVKLVYPDRGKEAKHLTFLGHTGTLSPSIALTQARLELLKMGEMVVDMLRWTNQYFHDFKRPLRKRVLKYEAITDSIHKEMMEFARLIMREGLSSSQSENL